MAKSKIEIVVSAKDKASRPLGGISNALGGIATVAGGILAAGLLVKLGEGIMGLGKGAIDNVLRACRTPHGTGHRQRRPKPRSTSGPVHRIGQHIGW
jgi:hypothetical protein